MEEEKSRGGGVVAVGGGGGGGGESARVQPKLIKSGDRQLFVVDIRLEETTYVSWKKLIKDANKVHGSAYVPAPPPNAHPNLESRLGPTHPAENEEKDEPGPNRFSAVIEKIERLYMGKDSSDEEELDNTPDDDQYDTEDSFIDDAELDEYFEVDNSAIKHDGFFVNRGKLERINEPHVVPEQQPKKRRRKDFAKAHGEIDDGNIANKHAKVSKSTVGKAATSLGKNSNPSPSLTMMSDNGDGKAQNQLNATGLSSRKKSVDAKMTLDPSSSLKVPNDSAFIYTGHVRDTEKPKTGAVQAKNAVGSKIKEASGSSDTLHQKHAEKSAYTQSKLHLKSSNADGLGAMVRQKENNGMRILAGGPDGKVPQQAIKSSHMQKKDGSALRPKSSMLEKAIRDLEKMVTESRPPTAMETQDADPSQAVKRRLPRDIKMKLAKVARIAQATQGKVSMELLNRLMSFLGHLMQLRTLKRNLKEMITLGLSAKQENDVRSQQIKKEVLEMIKTQVPSGEPQALEHQARASDDFQVMGSEQKVPLKRRSAMDTATEDKICDLYDLHVDVIDEDLGPQVRKLYMELAGLWPNGLMDNHGIKRAICRSKERRRALYSKHKDQEKIKTKKLLTPKFDNNNNNAVRIEATSSFPQQQTREKPATDSGTQTLSSGSKAISNTTTTTTTTAVQIQFHTIGSSTDKLKHDKLKGNASASNNPIDEAKAAESTTMVIKKKVKRKPEVESEESHSRVGEERVKYLKQSAGGGGGGVQNSNLQSTALSFNPKG